MANEYYKFRHEDSEFCYDSENLRLMKGTAEVELEKTPREVLAYLLKNPGKLIRYEDLKTTVWHQPYIDNASVYNAITKINRALRKDQPGADFIRTRKGEGVVFKAKVEVLPGPPPPPEPLPSIDSKVDGAEPDHTEVPSESGFDFGGAINAAAESGTPST